MTVNFTSSIVKKNRHGNIVLSSSLEQGEELVTGQSYDDVVANGVGIGSHTEDIEVETMTTDPTVTNTIAGKATIAQETPDEPGEKTPETEIQGLSPEEQGIAEVDAKTSPKSDAEIEEPKSDDDAKTEEKSSDDDAKTEEPKSDDETKTEEKTPAKTTAKKGK